VNLNLNNTLSNDYLLRLIAESSHRTDVIYAFNVWVLCVAAMQGSMP
jgi:hypothetical protein